MTSLLERAYEAYDEVMMYGVNKLFQGYNRLTGETKTDLANKLVVVAPTLEVVGCYQSNPALSMINTPFLIHLSYRSVKMNKQQEELEKRAEKLGMKNIMAEVGNVANKYLGTLWMGMSTFLILSPAIESYSTGQTSERLIPNLTWASGNVMRGLSHYVMRCEDLPKGKSVLSKAKTKLEEIVSEHKLSKKMRPQQV